MTKTLAEILLLLPITMFAGILVFYAGILRKAMNDMDAPAFQLLLASIIRHSPKEPFMIFITNATFIFMVPYWVVYGFSNWWFTSGLILGFITASISKIVKLPVYKKIAALDNNDVNALNDARRKFQTANVVQAIFTVLAVVFMIIGLK